MFKYNSSTHSIEELPEMKEPDHLDYKNLNKWDELQFKSESAKNQYADDYERYKEHIASLKSYPVAGEVKWKDGDILGEKDFRIGCKITPCHCKELENCEHPVAIPTGQNKEVVKPLDFDLLDKQIKEMFPMKTVEDKVFKIDFNGYVITLYKNEMLPEQYAMLSSDLYEKVFNHFKNQVK